MKKCMFISISILIILSISPISKADTFTFSPTPPDLYGLRHDYYYIWGVNWNIPAGHYIMNVILTIKDINDSSNDPNDHLYINLLNTAPSGVSQGYDGSQGYQNHFSGHPLIADYQDPGPGLQTLIFSFSSLGLLPTFLSYISDGNFGIGFDPDCHYWNNGITLEIRTAPIPEPTNLMLLGTGLIGLAIFYRLKSRKSKVSK